MLVSASDGKWSRTRLWSQIDPGYYIKLGNMGSLTGCLAHSTNKWSLLIEVYLAYMTLPLRVCDLELASEVN